MYDSFMVRNLIDFLLEQDEKKTVCIQMRRAAAMARKINEAADSAKSGEKK